MSTNEIKLPDYNYIVELAIKEMEIKFKNYGNDWLTLDDKYWKERISKEVQEYVDSMTVDSEQRKLLNILNMVCMAYELAPHVRSSRYVSNICPNCVKPLSVHIVHENEFRCEL